MTTDAFRAARDFLIEHREDYQAAYAGFRWPELGEFNWALDWFDTYARDNHRTALWIVNENGPELQRSFAELSSRSNQVANFLRTLGIRRGDRILVMLPNAVELWETTLAAIKLGAVISPATSLLSDADLHDRIERGQMRMVLTDAAGAPRFAAVPGDYLRIATAAPPAGWIDYATAAACATDFHPDGPTDARDPMLVYFTSGTTAQPKMVLHTHQSYPVGHLSTMYWLGLREGDIHFNISSPGWAKHAWSCLFAPWNAGATVFIYNQARFDPARTLATIARCKVTTLCAPPTAWRSFILQDLASFKLTLRELGSAGEPLNPEVIDSVRKAWGLTIREGYGQTESTAMLGCPPGTEVRPGSMGRPLPGYQVVLLDHDGNQAEEGELSVRLDPAPAGLMAGYADSAERTRRALGGATYGSSDVARRDADGFYWFVGRTDDVFKSSDYRISPFELESVLIEHPAVAEAAVVESPDARRLYVPKAFVTLVPGTQISPELAQSLFEFTRERLGPYKRIRRIEMSDLPKTVSGKIRRNELRRIEAERRAAGERAPNEFFEDDFAALSPRQEEA